MRRLTAVATIIVVLLAATGCGSKKGDEGASAATTTTAAPATTTTTAPPATTTTAPPPPPTPPPTPPPPPPPPVNTAIGAVPAHGLGPGDRGAPVQALEQRLAELRYDVGNADGVYDGWTTHAVVAFQKLNDLPRSGRATPDVIERLASAQAPGPLVPGGGATRVEISLGRQLLYLWQNDQLSKIVPVSTGSGKRFCDGGRCRNAITPTGSFHIERRVNGWHKSDLGRLYNPLFFVGGVAIHGFPSVPPHPASHGCVRIPMQSAGWFPSQVPDGTPVYVVK